MLVAGLVSGMAAVGCSQTEWPAETAGEGLVVALPGVVNTKRHLNGFVRLVREEHPDWEVRIRSWGTPLRSIHNLCAYERNRAVAEQIASELAAYRRSHPQARISLVGYSGGGGVAVFVTEALPADVMIERLILVAPAISPDYPLVERVLPHVSEYVINYASRRDHQVGFGTRLFGTIDRVKTASAGCGGFSIEHRKLIQVCWSTSMLRWGHLGNHLSYLVPRWQRKYLVPALQAGVGPDDLLTPCPER